MPVRNRRRIDRALRKKGFERDDRHHIFYVLMIDGDRTEVFTKMSHGRAEVGADLIARMAKQCRLSKDEFLQLVDCPMTGSEYVEMLKSRGHLMR